MTQRDRMSRRTLRADENLFGGFTLVEMLIAMAITLVMMAALVTVFANISGSVTRRRATIEMSSALRNVRATLARDLAGATCPAVPWQRPESNVGYLEIIEGPQNDYYPSPWLYSADTTTENVNGASITVAEPDANGSITEEIGNRPGIDLAISSLPGSNLRDASTPDDDEGRGAVIGSNAALPAEGFATDGRGLGDADDILMLTVRNEDEPFVGRIPSRTDGSTPANSLFGAWSQDHDVVESQLAEVVWFAVENPTEAVQTNAFGEPGYRTIYRRTLLIMPDLDYGIRIDADGLNQNGVRVRPGVVRVMQPSVGRRDVSIALAGLISFQERYDLSVRLEWDPLLPTSNTDDPGRWVLRANTLGDLTKRENRYEHHGYVGRPSFLGSIDRYFPFAVATRGVLPETETAIQLTFVDDRELRLIRGRPQEPAKFQSVVRIVDETFASPSNRFKTVVSYEPSDGDVMIPDRFYEARPMVIVNNGSCDTPASARAILNEDGAVVHVTSGLAPLGGSRRGDDVMMTDALAFDVRVFDPGAPTYAYYPGADKTVRADQIITPVDPGWASAFDADVPSWYDVNPSQEYDPRDIPGDLVGANAPLVWQRSGAYVDLGYGSTFINPPTGAIVGQFLKKRSDLLAQMTSGNFAELRFSEDGWVFYPQTPPGALTYGFAIYDTWSSHYESNGVDEDLDGQTDEGIDGLDSPGTYVVDTNGDGFLDDYVLDTRNGPDDPAERETRPPYDTALRGVQVSLRAYERDSRQIREVKVRESFVPE